MSEEKLQSWTLEGVSAEAMFTWAEALRDSNPIHLDPAAAEALGFGARVVNQGPANLAYLMNMLCVARPDLAWESVDARFLANVFAGDTVEARGTRKAGDPLSCEAVLMLQPGDTPVLELKALMRETEVERG